MTLSDLVSDCETCGTKSPFTGNTKVEGGRRFFIVRCPSCKVQFPVYKQSLDTLVAAYTAAKERVVDPLSFDTAWVVLRSGSTERVEKLLSFPVTELPLFGIDDLALTATSAEVWVRLLLEFRGFVPACDDATRIEEVLAAALCFQSPGLAAHVTIRVGSWDPSAFTLAFSRLPSRAGGKTGGVLLPVLSALRERGGGWKTAAEFAETRWKGTSLAR